MSWTESLEILNSEIISFNAACNCHWTMEQDAREREATSLSKLLGNCGAVGTVQMTCHVRVSLLGRDGTCVS